MGKKKMRAAQNTLEERTKMEKKGRVRLREAGGDTRTARPQGEEWVRDTKRKKDPQAALAEDPVLEERAKPKKKERGAQGEVDADDES
jgi:hypothetical protein